MSDLKDKSSSFRVPEDQLNLIKNYASFNNITYSEFMRRSAMEKIIPDMRHFYDVELPALFRKLNPINDERAEKEQIEFFKGILG